LVVAKAPKPQLAELPAQLQDALISEFPGARADAVRELERLLKGRHQGLALAAANALERLEREDDSQRVRSSAMRVLDANTGRSLADPKPELDPPRPQWNLKA
jgi:hypothetical protein